MLTRFAVRLVMLAALTLGLGAVSAEAANRCAPSAAPAGGCTTTHASMQAAIDAAVAGDTVYGHAGTTYTESITLPNKGVLASNITITTDAASGSLPAANVRTGPSYAAYMPIIQSPGGGSSAVYAANGANHYVFRHINFPNVPYGYGTIMSLGYGDSNQVFASQQPYNITVDQCYFHGDAVAGQKRAVMPNGKNIVITNNYMSQIVAVGEDSQCVLGFNGEGPVDIENNYLECGAENMMFGGADPSMRTYMRATGTPTTTSADVSTYETGHTLSELKVGQVITAKTTGGAKVEWSTITAITGTGATGTITWSPAMSAAPDVPGDLRAGVVVDGVTFRRNYVTKNPAWRNGVLAASTLSSPTPSTSSGTLASGTYCYEIMAFSLNGYQQQTVNGGMSNEQCATLTGTGQVSLSWSAVSGATSYRIWRGTSAGAEGSWTSVSGTSAIDNGSLTYTTATPFGATQWAEKNLLEIKAARNVQVDSNIFYLSWKGYSNGFASWWKSVNQDGGCWFCQSANIMVEKNIWHGTIGWFEVHGREGELGNLPPPLTNITFRNNLVYDSNDSYGPGDQYAMQASNTVVGLTIDHNTVVHTTSGTGGGLLSLDSSEGTMSSVVIRNNMLRKETYGIHEPAGEGTPGLAAAAPGYVFSNNAVAGASAPPYPSGSANIYPSYAAWEAGFVTYSANGAGADYRITSATAGDAFRGAGTDGKDLGADITLVNTATTGVLTGTGSSLTITTATLPTGVRTVAYSQTLAATGGSTPYTWAVTSGTAPAGLTLSSGGVLSGTPTTASTYTFTVTVTDNVAATATQSYTVTILQPVTITTTSPLPNATVNMAYSTTIAYTGGAAPYTCSVTVGSLPTGMSLNASTCVISGTATSTGTSNFTVTVAGSLGSSNSVAFALTVANEVLPSGRPRSEGPISMEGAFFRRPTAPVSGDKVVVGDLWSDTSVNPPLLKVAVSATPTWSQATFGSDGSYLTNLNASQLLSGTIPSFVFPASLSLSTSISAPTVTGSKVGTTEVFELTENPCSTISSSGKSRFCMDEVDHVLKVSQNGSAFAAIGSGGTGGSGSSIAGANSTTVSFPEENTDPYGMGDDTTKTTGIAMRALQGARQQIFRTHDANNDTAYVWGAGVSSDTGATWKWIWRGRQNGEMHIQQLVLDSIAAPTCSSSTRGQINYVAGGAGVKDIVQVCAKDASDVYAWRTIY